MSGIYRAMKCCAVVVAAAVMLLAVASPSNAETGSVRVTVTRAGFIVGIGGGSGTLHFAGRNYPFSVGGVSVGTRTESYSNCGDGKWVLSSLSI